MRDLIAAVSKQVVAGVPRELQHFSWRVRVVAESEQGEGGWRSTRGGEEVRKREEMSCCANVQVAGDLFPTGTMAAEAAYPLAMSGLARGRAEYVNLAVISPAVIGKLLSAKRFAFGKVHSLASGEEFNFWPASLRKENSAFDR